MGSRRGSFSGNANPISWIYMDNAIPPTGTMDLWSDKNQSTQGIIYPYAQTRSLYSTAVDSVHLGLVLPRTTVVVARPNPRRQEGYPRILETRCVAPIWKPSTIQNQPTMYVWSARNTLEILSQWTTRFSTSRVYTSAPFVLFKIVWDIPIKWQGFK